MQKASIVVGALWDPEARVWVATSEDIPGLATEAASQEELQAKLQHMIPELIELNDEGFGGLLEVPLVVMSEQVSKIRIRA